MTNEFTWRKLSEQDKKELDKRVQGILDDFGRKLDGVKEKVGEVFVEREEFVRDEKECEYNDEFRKTFFENAPKKKDDCIIAEKGEWAK